MEVIETERLILRTWNDEDADAYFKINQDPKVVESLSATMTMDEVKKFITAMNEQHLEYGYTFWAAEEKSSGKLIGFIGLNHPKWKSHFTPCTEIGWRLGSEYWNKGYATEGAKAALKYAFDKLGIKEIVSFATPDNKRSINVMQKIGMKHDLEGDFTYKHFLHVLYRIQA